MEDSGLVYIGKIISLKPIEGADYIVSATVECGKGGKWRGVVRNTDFKVNDLCIVYLPDSLIPENELMKFMEKTKWRVRMCRFKGSPSEVVIIKNEVNNYLLKGKHYSILGYDLTKELGVKKYHKPVPENLKGKALGEFPGFIPKTDEPNYQNSVGQEYIELLQGKPYYIAEKADGSSTTAYRYKGKFGVCSRNWELERDEKNGYWEIAIRYDLENKLPEGYAIQWETCGPKIQNNPMGWNKTQGLMFSAYNIEEKRYCTFTELCTLSERLNFPMVMIIKSHPSFNKEGVELLGEGNYDNGKPREGVVIRSKENLLGHKPISFKVINLNYEK